MATASDGSQPIDVTLDTRGQFCPVPIYLTAKQVRQMRVGQVVEVLSDDPGILADMPAWSTTTGHTIVFSEEQDKVYRYGIRKEHD